MRLIGSLPTPDLAKRFSQYLTREGIENTIEKEELIWISSEDDVAKANTFLEAFKKEPDSPQFDTIIPSIQQPTPAFPPFRKKQKAPFMVLLIATIIFIFMVSEWTAPKQPTDLKAYDYPMAFTPPIMKDLLYDYPKAYSLADEIYSKHSLDEIQHPSKQLKEELTILNHTPYWQGLYDEFLHQAKSSNPTWHYEGSLFEKIQQGEWWRLFTPALLHGNLLHILFNLLWAVVLGLQIERKIGTIKTILFVLITGIISNTSEYLMSGPNFLGFSGVVVAMAGFIWIRQRKAPWEGYLLPLSTIIFLTIFVFAMFFIQTVAFFADLYFNQTFTPGIANTAHITGGIAGILLGLFPFFAKKHLVRKQR